MVAISLGQGQGPLAEQAIGEAVDKGTWVCLQNCHLCVSWMPMLEKLCEDFDATMMETDFRLWLTSEPSKAFPQFVLQNGVKMTNEPPKGMRANLLGSYHAMGEDWYNSSLRPREFKKLLFGLCFFHATVRERKKFGPLGWNIQYVFSGPDLNISRDQLKIYIDESGELDQEVPFAALAYLAGECNYGGRVTDDKDRRCLINILSDFYCEDIMNDKYRFSPSGVYYAPPLDVSGEQIPPDTPDDEKDKGDDDEEETLRPLEQMRQYISALPFTEGPEVFGLHDNANISASIGETNLLLSTALSLQPRASGGAGKSWEDSLREVATDISRRVPEPYDTERAELDFPVQYEESMNTVLTQELMRFNTLNNRMTSTLASVQKALKGLVIMSAELEEMGTSMVNGQVPSLWAAAAYPSLKPLGAWVSDFLGRLFFLQEWLDAKRSPAVYWISGFFFTQAFITGTKQNFARKHTVPIDQVSYDMAVLTPAQENKVLGKRPDDGAYVHGLFLQGCCWDERSHALSESQPKQLFVNVPHVHLIPKLASDLEPVKDTTPGGTAHVYECPVYKTSLRQGVLSTTGHSTNFVMLMRLPMLKVHRQKHWIKRGVAMLTQLDY